MANQKNGNGMTTRKVATWLGGIAAFFTIASCLQIAGIDPPIFDPSVNGGAGGGAGESGSATSTGPGMGGAGGSMGMCVENALSKCYSGPPGTENVGICKAGTTICLFGMLQPCTSEFLPEMENCATTEDEDCDGTSSIFDTDCQYPSKWLESYGTPPPGVKDDALFAITPAKDGGYIVGGVVNGTIGLDNTSVSAGDAYIAKFGAMGMKVWEKKFVAGASSYAFVRGLSENADGTIVVVGGFNGTIAVDAMINMTSVGVDAFIVKLAEDGTYVSKRSISAPAVQIINGVTTDAIGNVFVVGSTNAQVDLGGGMSPMPTEHDIFIASYDSSGAFRWGNVFVNPGMQLARGIALIPGAGAEIVIAGVTNDMVNLGGANLPGHIADDIMLARYSIMNGAHVWSRTVGDAEAQDVNAIAVDSQKKLLLTGKFLGTIDWDGVMSSVNDQPTPSAYAARLSLTGDYENGIEAGIDGSSVGYGIGEDSMGNIVITGQFDGELDWGGMSMLAMAGVDSFVVKLKGSTWEPVFGTTIGDVANQLSWSIAAHGDGSVGVVGSFKGSLLVPPMTQKPTISGTDWFFARF